jgi:transglycosylase-like protein with SLT domain
VSGLRSGISSGASKIGTWVGDHVVTPVKHAFSRAGTWLTSSGRSMISGLTSGALSLLSDAKSGVMHWAGSVKNKIVGAIKSVFHIHSPSRVMAELGGHIMSGLLRGLLSGKDVLNSAVKGIFHSPLDAAKTLVKNGINVLGFFGKDAAKLTGQLWSSVGQDLTGGGSAATMGSTQALGKRMMLSMGWAANQWPMLKQLWINESGWRTNALNSASGAYGIPQALPAAKMASAGPDWRTNPATQIAWGLQYIRQRYGTPGNALGQWQSRSPHWYDSGGIAYSGGYIPKLTNRPERVLSPRQTEAFERLVGVLADGGGEHRGATTYNIYPQRADFTTQDLEVVQRRAEARQRFGRPR